MLGKGDHVPYFSVRCVDGTTIAYVDLWQRRNLLLVSLTGKHAGEDRYIAELAAHGEAFQEYEAAVVVTYDPVPGLPAPAILVADRWGEIIAVEAPRDAASLPDADDLVAWLRFVAQACPECEGEAR